MEEEEEDGVPGPGGGTADAGDDDGGHGRKHQHQVYLAKEDMFLRNNITNIFCICLRGVRYLVEGA
jgi:hypothetical protein